MEKGSQFKDVFNRSSITELAERINYVYPDFQLNEFVETILKDFTELSLSERSMKICEALKVYLPEDFPKAVDILIKSQTAENEDIVGNNGFVVMPQAAYISNYGLYHFEISIQALEEMTKRFTSEFAIRFFFIEHPEKTLSQMKKWAQNENYHVRRLASEGSRPLLPWAIRLKQFVEDPRPVIEILELLKFSPERYVERSVANNLNDISKHHPNTVTQLLSKWQKQGVSPWLITHALRTLFKQGNPEALKLNGYDPEAQIEVTEFAFLTPTVDFGNNLEFSFKINSKRSEKLMVDYIVHHVKASGKLAPKVFKLTKKTISGQVQMSKKHSIRSITTRKYYPGKHLLQIQINGKVYAEGSFELLM